MCSELDMRESLCSHWKRRGLLWKSEGRCAGNQKWKRAPEEPPIQQQRMARWEWNSHGTGLQGQGKVSWRRADVTGSW